MSTAESQGSSRSRWGMYAQPSSRSAGSERPPTEIEPESGGPQPCEQLEQRGLAAAGGADDPDDLAGLDLEVDSVDHPQLAEGVGKPAHANRTAFAAAS